MIYLYIKKQVRKINREERTMNDKRRIKFVAGSRAKKTLWTIKSKGQLSL